MHSIQDPLNAQRRSDRMAESCKLPTSGIKWLKCARVEAIVSTTATANVLRLKVSAIDHSDQYGLPKT